MSVHTTHKGFGIVEIVISAAIVVTIFSAFFLFYQRALIMNQQTTALVQSNMLLVEGVEVLKLMRDESWTTNIASLSTSTVRYLIFTGSDWEVAATSTPIDSIYTRSFIVEDVYRDANDDIATSGTYDGDVKKLTVSVSYDDRGATSTESLTTYITNFFDN